MAESVISFIPTLRDPDRPLEPAPQLAAWRQQSPVVPLTEREIAGRPQTLWLVTGYPEVRQLLASPAVSNVFNAWEQVPQQPGFLLNLDPPEHTRIRRLLTREFSVKRIQALRPRIEQIVAEALDHLAAEGPGSDLVSTVALPVPSQVICELLGVPYAERATFRRLSDAILDPTADQQQRVAGFGEMNAYIGGLVTRHRRQPGDDVLGVLVRDHGDDVSDAELVGIGNLLLIAGHETTANTIALGTLLLLQHPDQLTRWRVDPGLTRNAVEEILRYLTTVNSGPPRVLTEDLELGGQQLRSGDGVMLSLASANRDRRFLPDADTFDVTRPPGAVATFGHGIHQCLGQQLARVELAITFVALFDRFPTLRLAVPPGDLRFHPNGAVNGVDTLPVAW